MQAQSSSAASERGSAQGQDLSCANVAAHWDSLKAREDLRHCSRDADCVLVGGAESCEETRMLDPEGAAVSSEGAQALREIWRFWEEHCEPDWPLVADAKRAENLRCEKGLCTADGEGSCSSPTSD